MSDSDKLAPSALFSLLTSGTRPHKMVDLPRLVLDPSDPDKKRKIPIGKVAMVALTQAEMISVAATSEQAARTLLAKGLPKKDEAQLGYDDVYNNTAAVEILYRACKDPDDETLKRGAFRTPHEISTGFTNDEIGVLHHHYLTVKSEMGPIITEMLDEEIDAWITLLAEGASALPLGGLSWGALTHLMISMASRLHNLRTDKSLPGSPVDPITESADSSESSPP